MVTVRVNAHPPFTLFTITYKVAVHAPAERADTLNLFHLYDLSSQLELTTTITTLYVMGGGGGLASLTLTRLG
jgi:hypothetical protein